MGKKNIIDEIIMVNRPRSWTNPMNIYSLKFSINSTWKLLLTVISLYLAASQLQAGTVLQHTIRNSPHWGTETFPGHFEAHSSDLLLRSLVSCSSCSSKCSFSFRARTNSSNSANRFGKIKSSNIEKKNGSIFDYFSDFILELERKKQKICIILI